MSTGINIKLTTKQLRAIYPKGIIRILPPYYLHPNTDTSVQVSGLYIPDSPESRTFVIAGIRSIGTPQKDKLIIALATVLQRGTAQIEVDLIFQAFEEQDG